MMRLVEGDEFVRGILEPAGLCLEDVQRSRSAGAPFRTLNLPHSARRSRSSRMCAFLEASGRRGMW